MNATLKCTNCGSRSQVVDYNVCRMGSNCYVCGYWNSLSGFLEAEYGETVGKVVRKELAWLERAGERQTADLRTAIQSVELMIHRAIAQAA